MTKALRALWGVIWRTIFVFFGTVLLLLAVVFFFTTPGIPGTTPICLGIALWLFKYGSPRFYVWLCHRWSIALDRAKSLPYIGKGITWLERIVLSLLSWLRKKIAWYKTKSRD